jgi:hypothetical protein
MPANFENTVRLLGFDFAVGVQSTLRVVRLDSHDCVSQKRETDAQLVGRLGSKAFRKLTWREGSNSKLGSRFCFTRVNVPRMTVRRSPHTSHSG